jgi:hypothetical protein
VFCNQPFTTSWVKILKKSFAYLLRTLFFIECFKQIFLILGVTEKTVEGVHIKSFYLITYPVFSKMLADNTDILKTWPD